MPLFIPPQLATPTQVAPDGPDWLHEIKLDGYRMACRLGADGEPVFLSRQGKDWSTDLSELRDAMRTLGPRGLYVDGEIAIRMPDGRTNFGALQDALSGGARAGLTYFAFDLLHEGETSLVDRPLEIRKQRLAELLSELPQSSCVAFVDHISGQGPAMLESARRLGLEGIISKRAQSPYRSGRTSSWMKIKCKRRQEFVVGGFTLRKGQTDSVGSLVCGYYDDHNDLRCVGRVGTGFTDATARSLYTFLGAQRRIPCPFVGQLTPEVTRGAAWVAPEVVVEVEFTAWTDDGQTRHAVFMGVRRDKAPTSVRREES